jgi:hypothetical protein
MPEKQPFIGLSLNAGNAFLSFLESNRHATGKGGVFIETATEESFVDLTAYYCGVFLDLVF